MNFLNGFLKNPQPSDFTKNSSCGSRVVPCRQEDRQTDVRTDMTKPKYLLLQSYSECLCLAGVNVTESTAASRPEPDRPT